jgi:hypothetical protein
MQGACLVIAVRVASIQMGSVALDKAANFERIRALTSQAVEQRAKVVVSPGSARPATGVCRT